MAPMEPSKVNLSHTQLSIVPADLPRNLQELWLSSNLLAEIPTTVGELAEVRRLVLSDNQLEALPASIAQMHKLDEIYASNNRLSSLPDLTGLPLRSLLVTRNELTALPICPTLQELGVAHNHIQQLEKVSEMAHLRCLWAGHNHLVTVPAAIANLTELEELYLDHNRLITLPDVFDRLTKLQVLTLAGNTLVSIPPSLVAAKERGLDVDIPLAGVTVYRPQEVATPMPPAGPSQPTAPASAYRKIVTAKGVVRYYLIGPDGKKRPVKGTDIAPEVRVQL